ncbi:hypothetical protein DV736_g1988, partial [Chaetothyriales sp. CBS 134916]
MSTGTDSKSLGLNMSLRSTVRQKFVSALRSGDLLFSETQLAILPLSKKPKDNVPPKNENPKPKQDPFDDPRPELLISETPTGAHILLLNKYPVIPNHFILATKANKPQTHLLDQDDLAVSYACLRAWQEDASGSEDGQLFAFFNSGEHSGASQPHRHIQFVPVSDMRINNTKWQHPDTFDWNPLILSMKSNFHASSTINYTSNARLPIRHFASPLHDESPTSLYSKYISLLKLATVATRNPAGAFITDVGDVKIDEDGEITFSYNLAMTTEILAICPRQVESASIPGLDSSHSVSVNGTILGGTLMVKEQQEWDALRNNHGALDSIIETIGFPIEQDSQPLISPNTIPSSTHL